MNILSNQSIFSTMLQNGPFATNDTSLFPHPFSREAKAWTREIRSSQLLKTKYRAVRNQIFDLLNIENFDQLLALIHNDPLRCQRANRAHLLLSNMFDTEPTQGEIRRYLHDYSQTADDVIRSLQTKILAPFSSHIETTNEIGATSDPVNLLLILFDDRFHQKVRFEAKRKLMLMSLASAIDQRERESKTADKFSEFLTFLNNFVWSPNHKIGDLKIHYLYSTHNPDDFSTTSVKVLSSHEGEITTPSSGEKLTLIKRRSFLDQNAEIPVYVTIRKKPPSAKVLKLLRKNEKNPAAAVDDDLGLMAVLNSLNDVKRFLRHLTRAGARANSFMTLEDISDTLSGGRYSGTATGSSQKTPMLKFFAKVGGMRVEFIIHTNQSYLNYIYQRGVAHDEYEVKRIFDSGVAEFLFPTDIYNLRLEEIRNQQLSWFRKHIEEN